MTKLHQKGFSILEVLLVVVVLGLLIGGGLYIYRQNNKTETTASTNPSAQNNTDPVEDEAPQAIEITEWGVKIETKYADKLTYEYYSTEGNLPVGDMDAYDSSVAIVFKPGVMQDESCEPGFGFQRLKENKDDEFAKTVNGRTYTSHGAPGPCFDDPNNPDEKLKVEVLSDIDITDLSAL